MDLAAFPRQYARTRRFTLGAPRSLRVSPDGSRVVFLRSRGGSDPVNCLWSFDLASGEELLQADPLALLGGAQDDLPPEERARRERAREQASGIVSFSTDRSLARACYVLSGQLWVQSLDGGSPRLLPAEQPVVHARLDPSGNQIGYVSAGALRLIGFDGTDDRLVAAPDGPQVSYGLPDFVAAEEMGRSEGYWWAPDGSSLLVARVDNSAVSRWYISDPANPWTAPNEVAYPAAGTANAEVSLWLFTLQGSRRQVVWDAVAFEYVVTAAWGERSLLVVVQSRDQRRMQVLEVDAISGETSLRRQDEDPCWVTIVAGVPAFTSSGSLVWAVEADGARRLMVGEELVTPPSLQLRSVLSVDGDTVLFSASEEPTEVQLWTWSAPAGLSRLSPETGVHDGVLQGGTAVLTSRSLSQLGATVTVRAQDKRRDLTSYAETSLLEPRVEMLILGERRLNAALVLPTWYSQGSGPLPVLLDPYGGPHHQKVLSSLGGYAVSQWFAEQGFAVLVADGRGSPARGTAWERAIYRDFAGPVLEDQLEALDRAAQLHPEQLDLSRVAMRGWSFGGWLSALAVLVRPDVFHAAVAGAPVTDHRLYDTHYEERYLGHPEAEPQAYERNSLLPLAAGLRRPLLVVHGLVDDNVVVAHTLRLSSALLAAGRPHSVLPLSGVTHMTPQEVVAEKLLLLEREFLLRSLGMPDMPDPAGGGQI